MTAIDSAHKLLGEIAAAGVTAAWNIANLVLDGCGNTHAAADLRGFGNLRDGSGPLCVTSSGTVSSGLAANAGVATSQSCRLPKEDADQINKEGRLTDT